MSIDPGNTLVSAFNFGNLSGSSTLTWDQSVSSTDLNDYYRFSLATSSSFSITLSGLSADADLQLLNASGSAIATSDAAGTASETISRQLAPGTYYIRVYPFLQATTSYSLSLSGVGASVDPGNLLANAYDLGTYSDSERTFSDSVSATDRNDYFQIQLAERSILNLSLTRLSADADLELLSSTGSVLNSSFNAGSTSEQLSQILNAGTYYIRVLSFDNILTNYDLRISDTPTVATDDTLATARSLTLGATPLTITDFVGDGDRNDYYRFSLSSGNALNLSLTQLTSDIDLELIRDINGNGTVDSGDVVARSVRAGSNDESITLANLAVGTYFVRVYQFSGNSNYTLRLSTSDPSDLLVDEFVLATPGSDVIGSVSNSNTSDTYRFSLTTPGVFTASISDLSADADIRLISDRNNNGIIDAGEVIAQSIRGSTLVDSLTQSLEAGTYFFQVYQFSGETQYRLQVVIDPPDLAGNTLQEARTITVGTTPVEFNDFVGVNDANDYYRFNLVTASNFNLVLTGLDADADVELLSSDGRLIQRSKRPAINDETINTFLSAGTYYVRVFPDIAGTNYQLRLSTTPATTPSTLISTEFNAGALGNTPLTFTGALNQNNTLDTYRINLSTLSNLNITLSGLSPIAPNNADIRIIRDSNNNGRVDPGEELARSALGVGQNEALNLNALAAGTYFVQVYRINGATAYTLNLRPTPVSGGTRIFSGTLGADTFSYTAGYSRLVFSGNGNVDYGNGSRDLLDLSSFSSLGAIFNYADSNPTTPNDGVLFNPGNGTRLFDGLTLSNGVQVLFEGIERIRFSDRVIDVFFQNQLPNDPLFNQQWNLHMMGVHNTWRFTQGSTNVLIGVQDTGLGTTTNGSIHPDLRSTTILTDNYRDDFSDGIGDTSHGMGVQGIIAAATNNGIGMSGINWNSPVYAIDVLGGERTDRSIANAAQEMINEARRRGTQQRLVINMSLGVPESFDVNYHQDLEQIVRNNRDVLFVITAGNYGHLGRSGIGSPGFLARNNDNVMAIGASWGRTDRDGNSRDPGQRIQYSWWGSQYGDGLTLMGPSEVISTLAINTVQGVQFDYYTDSPSRPDQFNGTSAAAPNVTGVASLVWSVNPNLTATQVRQILSQTAYDLGTPGRDNLYGHGFINADAAVRRAIALGRSSAIA
jgi:hypothetical protein